MRKIQLYFYGTMAIIMFTVSCIGCVNISYISPTGESLTYNRWLGQKITGLRIIKNKDGLVKFEFNTQEGEAGKAFSNLTETIKNFSETLKTR